MWVNINGNIMPEKNAVVSAIDHGFLYGIGMFETLRAYDRQLFLWEEHFERLKKSCSDYDIVFPYRSKQLKNEVLRTLDKARFNNAYIRISVSAGDSGVGLISEAYTKPNFMIYVKALSNFSRLYEDGKPLELLKLPRVPSEVGAERLKSFHFANNVLAKKALKKQKKRKVYF